MSEISPKERKGGRRGISCPFCSARQQVAAAAESVFCRKCHEYISLKDHVLKKSHVLESVVTRGNILVKRNGDVKGNLTGSTVVIEGKVVGDLKADQRICLRASSHVYGDVSAPRVVMEDGAVLVGKCEVQTATNTQSAAAATNSFESSLAP